MADLHRTGAGAPSGTSTLKCARSSMFQVPESALEAGAVLVKSTKNVLGDIVLRTALVAEGGFC